MEDDIRHLTALERMYGDPQIILTPAQKERLLRSTPESARELARRIVREEFHGL